MKLLLIALCPLILFGCTDKVKVLARNTTVARLADLIRDYAGVNGFAIKYRNVTDEKGSFLIFVEKTSSITPAAVETTFIKSSIIQRSPTNSMIPSSRETTGRMITQETPSQVIDTVWNFNVLLYQRGNDVYIVSQSSGGFDPARYFRGLVDQMNEEGIQVESAND